MNLNVDVSPGHYQRGSMGGSWKNMEPEVCAAQPEIGALNVDRSVG